MDFTPSFLRVLFCLLPFLANFPLSFKILSKPSLYNIFNVSLGPDMEEKKRMCTKRNTKTLPISKAIFFILKISIKMKTHRTGFEIIGKSQCHNQNRTQYLRYHIFWPVVACYMWVSLISFNIYHMPSWEQFILFR